MKYVLLTLVMLATGARALAADRPRLRDAESPRATDLLRAERLAEDARKRLALPRRKAARWARGGSGWSAPSTREPKDRPVVIQLNKPTRRRAKR